MWSTLIIFSMSLKRNQSTYIQNSVVPAISRDFIARIKPKPISKFYDALETINISQDDVAKVEKKPSHCFISEENIQIFKDLNISSYPVNHTISCLKMNPRHLYNKGELLNELGVKNLNPAIIKYMCYTMFESQDIFKCKMGISSSESISDILYNFLKQKYPDMPCQFRSSKEDEPVYDIYKFYFLQFEAWLLKLPSNDKSVLAKQRFQSFKMFEKTVSFWRNDCQCGDRELLKYKYLTLNLYRAEEFLNYFKNRTIAGLQPKEVLLKFPNIVNYDLNNIAHILEIAVRHNISGDMIYKNLRIFIMKKDVFLKRLLLAKSIPECEMWMRHPKFLQIVYCINSVLLRVKHLQSIGLSEWCNYTLLTCGKLDFCRRIEGRYSVPYNFEVIRYLLYKHLSEIRPSCKIIMKNPCWKYVPPGNINDTLSYLTNSFSADDIYSNLHIILYPRRVVSKLLIKVKSKCYKEYNFTPSQELAMCLYLLEKNNHFTGNSILLQNKSEKNSKGNLRKSTIDDKVLNVLDEQYKIYNSL